MNKVKNQHYIPQFYLKQWANNKEQLFVYDKKQCKNFTSNISNIASSRFFYDFPEIDELVKNKIRIQLKKDGFEDSYIDSLFQEQVLENSFSQLESIISPLLNQIIGKIEGISALSEEWIKNYPIFTNNDKKIFAHYIASQLVRTNKHKLFQEDITNQLFDGWKRIYKNKTKDNLIIQISNDYNEWQYLSNILSLTFEFSKILENYKWIIYRNFIDMPYYTSDNPVAQYGQLGKVGLKEKGVEIRFPLSPKYELVIHEPTFLYEQYSLLDINNIHILDNLIDNIQQSNDLQIQNSDSQIYTNVSNYTFIENRLMQIRGQN
ncbi:DUF4238 domain-containing protein [Aliarcobacter butzleri]|uniref:DUF4238 domain-containing protein n=1 Tax=Aliarcobacter butzleri TaxID=28197 RepID=UPI00125F0580|nr:DUF4238 domain-containing protein [Aliarcobacter butzleri]MCG3677576.1 DUF4238 domain-containing protein [Aliarcobacter butzleri]